MNTKQTPMFEAGTMTLGVNYWASHAATRMWSQWDAEVVDRDFAALAGIGVKVLRVFPIWPDFQPIMVLRTNCWKGGYPRTYAFTGERPLPDTPAGRAGVDEAMLERFAVLADLAEKHGMKLIVPLFNGHMTFRVYLPPALDGLDVFNDPISLMWQVRFIRCFVGRFKDHPALLAWELGNECNCISAADTRECAWSWTSRITDAIRTADPGHPVYSGMHSLQLHDRKWKTAFAHPWLIEDQAENCDMLTTHPYSMWRDYINRDPANTLRWCLLPSAENRLFEDIGGKPSFVEEIGTLRRTFSDFPALGRQYNAILWLLWANACRGALWWCSFDQTALEFPPYDWDEAGMEHGIMRCDHTPNPTGRAIASFAEFLEKTPTPLPARSRKVVCVLGRDQEHYPLANAVMALTAQAGLGVRFVFCEQELPEAEVYLVPCFVRKGGLNRAGFRTLLDRVERGATLYLSSDHNGNLVEMPEVCGVEIVRRVKNDAPLDLHLTLADGPLSLRCRPEHLFTLESRGAEPLDDGGLFWEFKRGKGRVVFAALPLEQVLLAETESFQKQDAWKFYRHLASRMSPQEHIRVDDAEILCSEHPESDTRITVVAVNASPDEKTARLTLANGWRIDGFSSNDDAASCRENILYLPPNAGILLRLSKP